ncbi:hypothetical protein BK011_02530 [Tenericutes bacterium MZ-XQ]|nr:hypothetical protein BK011_02530 [Tenericutes bacterium MZ-XQ]
MEILFLEPIFKERIWGGQKLKKVFNYPIKDKPIGECWAISGHQHGSSKVLNGPYEGMKLDDLFSNFKTQLFNNDPSDRFPLLVKILDANDDLSIQVHPDDQYAMTHENDYGKTECWYVIDADEDAIIIDGHYALTKQEFIEKIKQNDLSLWKTRQIKKDDFIYIPAKKVHAIGKGSLIYEVQQSSDTTYRIYDYDRKDDHGKKRDLHLDKALDVIDLPSKDIDVDVKFINHESYDLYHYIKNEYFELTRVDVKQSFVLKTHKYQLCSVLEGHGYVNNHEIKKGDHFILTGQERVEEIVFKGNMRIMMTQRPYESYV